MTRLADPVSVATGVAGRGPKESGFLAKSAALALKDLRIEVRARDTLAPMLAFSFTVALVLSFTLPTGAARLTRPVELPAGTAPVAEVLAGFLWITVLFAGLIGFARTFEVDRDEGALDSLVLVPLDRSGLFLAKAAANLVYLVAVEIVLIAAFTIFFAFDVVTQWPLLLALVALVDIGFTSVGTLLSSVAAQTRSRELILPILALPLLVPVFIAAVELSSDLFLGRDLEQVAARGWFAILVAFDVIASAVAALTFEFVVD